MLVGRRSLPGNVKLMLTVLLLVVVVVYRFVDMPCDHPITLKSEDVVPCGYCPPCLQLKRMDWAFRLNEEQLNSYSSHFLTLTYADKTNTDDLVKEDLQKFTKRLRTFHDRAYDGLVPLRYYSVGEYGELLGRPHYHSVMFNMIPEAVDKLQDIWGHGHVHVGDVTPASIMYVCGYVITRHNHPGREPPFAMMSKKPGLGAGYLHQDVINYHKHGKVDFVSRHGIKSHMARYYRERIFDDVDRKALRSKQLVELEAAYDRSIEQLRDSHSNPYAYYEERRRFASEQIGKRIGYTF